MNRRARPGGLQRRLGNLLALGLCWSATAALACDRATFRIVLDIGHTEAAPGAISARGVTELTYNRRLAEVLRARLAADGFATVKVLNGRPDGVGHAELMDRIARANAFRPDALLSLHHDSMQREYLETWTPEGGTPQLHSERFSGFSLFVSRQNSHAAQSLTLAREIGRRLIEAGLHFSTHHAEMIRGENRPWADKRFGIYAFDQLAVARYTDAPAVLLESGVIVNRDEETILASSERRDTVAKALSGAFAAFCDDH